MDEQKVFFKINYENFNNTAIRLCVAIHSDEYNIIIDDYDISIEIIKDLTVDIHNALNNGYKLDWLLFDEIFSLEIANGHIDVYGTSDIEYSINNDDNPIKFSDELANEFVNRLYEFLNGEVAEYIRSL